MSFTLARDIDARLARLAQRRSGAPGDDAYASALTGAHAAATSPWSGLPKPSPDDLKANRYRTGPAVWQGFGLQFETPAQGIREGSAPDGTSWRNVMKAHYGYFAGTVGADGEGVDIFLGPFPESPVVWVLNQTNADGSFDEHKVLAGFVDARAAVDAYRLSYTPGWDRYGAPLRLSIDQLRWWLKWADKTRPITAALVPPGEPDTMTETLTPSTLPRVFWDAAAMPAAGRTLADVLYAVRLDDAAEGLLTDPMAMADIVEGADRVVMDSLVLEAGRLKPKMDALLRVMEAVGAEVKPVALQISDPIRRFGGAHVAALFELSDGQTVTVWFHNPDSTPAKLTPADTLVSWKWVLNKKDVSIVVAPESGQDLNLREVARRVIRLAAKNSAAFSRANAKRAATMVEIEGLRGTLAERQVTLSRLHGQIEVAKVAAEGRKQPPASLPATLAAPEYVKPAVEVSLTGSELGDFDPSPAGVAALRNAAGTHLEGLRGLKVHCPALDADVEVRKSGIKKVLHASADPRKLMLVAQIEEIIRVGHKLRSSAPYAPDRERSIVAYHLLRTVVRLGDESLAVRVVIKEDDKGAFHWDHTVHAPTDVLDTAKENSPDEGLLPGATSNGEGSEPSHFARTERAASFDDARRPVKAVEMLDSLKENGSTEADPQSDTTYKPGASADAFQVAGARPDSPPRDETILDAADGSVNAGEVLNLFIEGEAAEPIVQGASTAAHEETAEVTFLREVQAGAHDALALGDLLDRIEASVKAITVGKGLASEVDALACEAIARWVALDEKAYG